MPGGTSPDTEWVPSLKRLPGSGAASALVAPLHALGALLEERGLLEWGSRATPLTAPARLGPPTGVYKPRHPAGVYKLNTAGESSRVSLFYQRCVCPAFPPESRATRESVTSPLRSPRSHLTTPGE